MQNIARHFRQLLPLRHFASRSVEVPQSIEFRIALHNAPAVNLKGRQPWAAVHCSDGITSIALCGESSSLATLHFNGAVRLWSLDGEVPREADGSLDCLRSRAHYLETEVIPVGAAAVHDASLLHADAAPRVLVLQPNNLAVWGAKKFELQPATSAARSHGVFHDRIKTLYSVFESSKKGSDLQMTSCLPDVNAQIEADVPPPSPAESVFVQIIAPAGCSSALALRRDGCVMAVPVPDKVLSASRVERVTLLAAHVHAQLDTIDHSDTSEPRDHIDNNMKLPLFSLLALEGGTGRMCAVPGSGNIVAIAGRERETGTWSVHLVDVDMLLLLNSAPLLPHISRPAFSSVALNAHTAGDGTVHVAAALLHSDNTVSWVDASLSSSVAPSTALRATTVVFKLGNSVVEAPLMREGASSVLLEDDGRARVKQVVGNSLMNAALLDGNLLLAWRAK